MAEYDEAKQEALEVLEQGLSDGKNPVDILDEITRVWDGDPM